MGPMSIARIAVHAAAAGLFFYALNRWVLEQPDGVAIVWALGAAGLAAGVAWRQARG